MTNKLLWAGVALAALFVTVDSLLCKSCSLGIFGTCFRETTINCTSAGTNCYTGEAKFNATELVNLYASGCLPQALCRNESGSILTAGFTVTRHCCNTDRCNGASSIQLPLTAALGAALVAMWSSWDH